MKDQLLDEYHDLAITNNDFAVVSGLPEQVQAIRISLLTVQREYWLNWKLGVPWNHGMFQPWMTQAERVLQIKKAVMSVQGVLSAEVSYTMDRENRAVLSEVSIETIEGKIEKAGL